MTPEDFARKALLDMGMRDADNDADVTAIESCILAALRERDAEHEIALKKARANALEEAAREALRLNAWGGYADAPSIARRLRALLEEAGK